VDTDEQVTDEQHPDSPGRGRPRGAALDITIRTGTGSGSTDLAAFDAALFAAGVGDLNLLTLSSVIPAFSPVRPGVEPVVAAHGDRLYCVLSTAHARQPGETAWAGLGWTYGEETGGLFVEHAGPTEHDVVELIRASLHDMGELRGRHFGPPQWLTARATCTDRPACAVVVAAYAVEGW
jgi:arginine decarboxylase